MWVGATVGRGGGAPPGKHASRQHGAASPGARGAGTGYSRGHGREKSREGGGGARLGVSRLQQDAEGLILPRQDRDGDKGEEERADEHDEEGQADVVQHQQLKVQLRGRGGART